MTLSPIHLVPVQDKGSKIFLESCGLYITKSKNRFPIVFSNLAQKGSRVFFQARKQIFYLLNSRGGPQSFDFDIWHLITVSCTVVGVIMIAVLRKHVHSPLNVDDSALWILYMLKQLLSSSLIEVMKPGCPGIVESGDTILSWLYPQSIVSQCKIKDQRYCVWS